MCKWTCKNKRFAGHLTTMRKPNVMRYVIPLTIRPYPQPGQKSASWSTTLTTYAADERLSLLMTLRTRRVWRQPAVVSSVYRRIFTAHGIVQSVSALVYCSPAVTYRHWNIVRRGDDHIYSNRWRLSLRSFFCLTLMKKRRQSDQLMLMTAIAS